MRFEKVSYAHDGTDLTGLLIRPERPARAAVAVYPTIANCTPAIEDKARALAQRGYIALICDFYGKQPQGMEQAFAWADDLRKDPAFFRERLRAGLTTLAEHSGDMQAGAIGFCLGGHAVLELARGGDDLFAVTSFHGLLETRLYARPGSVKARILVCHGDADPLVKRDAVLEFWQEMDAARANWHFHSYGGVKHGFTNPYPAPGSDAVAYDESADRHSWTAMLSLFDECLG
jgi:dienelactone hydrolase